ncbi:hypothetical protein B0H11DRAFT_2222752 [Mycena galericulata]|nr:hypothetical protein B0H11DRAFT_2222752 [Mycena galericulata]
MPRHTKTYPCVPTYQQVVSGTRGNIHPLGRKRYCLTGGRKQGQSKRSPSAALGPAKRKARRFDPTVYISLASRVRKLLSFSLCLVSVAFFAIPPLYSIYTHTFTFTLDTYSFVLAISAPRTVSDRLPGLSEAVIC